MSINDRQLAFLKGQGYTGSINDAYRAYLLAQLGVTTGSIDDLLYAYLKGRWGYSGNLNDMLFAHLRYLGYTGSLNDMLYAAWGAAGIAGVSFSGNLTTSILPEYAVGSKAPTYTRATTATITDHENIVRPVLSGEARFQGARRVANLIAGSSENLTNASWTKDANGVATYGFTDPYGGSAASKWVTTASGVRVYNASTGTSFACVDSVWLKGEVGGEQVELGDQASRVTLTLTATWRRYSYYQALTGSAFPQIRSISASSTTIYVYGFQRENVTGQSNQSPAEYVSVGAAKLNELLYSQDFDNAKWIKSNSTVTADNTTAPDNTTTADKILETVAVGTHQVVYDNAVPATIVSGLTYTISVYAKAGLGRDWFRLGDGTGFLPGLAYFNLTTGVVGTVTGSGATASIQSVGSGWYRCSVTSIAAGTTCRPQIVTADADASASYAGDITKGLYVWGAQLVQGTSAGTYFPVANVYPFHGAGVDGVKYFNTTNGNSVSSNVVSEASGSPISSSTLLGYLSEGARTNRILWSEDLSNAAWVKRGTVSPVQGALDPYGGNNGWTLTVGLGGANDIYQINGGFTASATVAGSFWMKRVSTTGTLVVLNPSGTGEYRVAMASLSDNYEWIRPGHPAVTVTTPFSATAGGAAGLLFSALSGSVSFVYGVSQQEESSFASTYIPTTTASVTRNADVLTYPSSGNILGTVGTFYCEATLNALYSYNTLIAGSTGNRYLASIDSSGAMFSYDGTTAPNQAFGVVANSSKKFGISWGSGRNYAYNGTTSAKAFDGDFDIGPALNVGFEASGVNIMFGTLRNVRIYQTQLSASQLQAVTT